jgi:hypothetical protein
MYKYLAKYNLLHDVQSGFRSNHSCQAALVNIIDKGILGPMLSVPVDLFLSRFKRSCSNSFLFTGGIENCVFWDILSLTKLYVTYMFNRIIDSGIYPNIFKNAKVSPIFKSGENVSLQITSLYLYYPLYPK